VCFSPSPEGAIYTQNLTQPIERIGCDRDHIHLLCSAHPKYAPGQLVRVFKSITARELFNRFSTLEEELWGGEFWTDGYYVASVGERGNWDVVERYIRAQVELTRFRGHLKT